MMNTSPIKLAVVLSLVCSLQALFAQNLVINPGFEDYTACPTALGQLNVLPWAAPNLASPDFYHSCGTGGASVPNNAAGTQEPHCGSGYAGMILQDVYTDPPFEFMEYLQGRLSAPLLPGQEYCVSFYINAADISGQWTDDICIYFSSTTPFPTFNSGSINFVPQLCNEQGNFVTDSVGWTLISLTYVATGGERHFIIGNFNSWANTSTIGDSTFYAYYLIDDVYIGLPEKVDLGLDTTLCEGDSLVLDIPYECSEFLWQDASTDSMFTVTQAGKYWVDAALYGCPSSDTILVDYNLSNLDLPGDTILCDSNAAILLDATTPNATYNWHNNTAIPTFTVINPGKYWVDVSFDNCLVSDTIEVDYGTTPALDLGNDTTICKEDTLTLNIAFENASYAWNDGSTDSIYYIYEEGEYSVQSTIGECTNHDVIVVKVNSICEVELILPLVFSPNGDGINDLFTPVVAEGVESLEIKIYNRWGILVYATEEPLIDWNGKTFSDTDVPQGTYFWHMEYSLADQSQGERNGVVTVIR